MAAAIPLLGIRFQAMSVAGIVPGGFVATYQAGTLVPQVTYSGPVIGALYQNLNPVPLDSAGQADIYLDPALSYRFVITDWLGATIPGGDRDNFTATDWSANAFGPSTVYQAGSAGAAISDNRLSLMWFVTTQAERLAIRAYTSTTDHTALFNTAIGLSRPVYVPAGRWNVDPAVGIQLQAGSSLTGAGEMRTVIKAAATGGSIAELIAYTKGSVIKRAFTTGVAQSRVDHCYLSDFSIILNHPAYNAANYKQIGVDLRNISYSRLERIYVGNEAPSTDGFPLAVTVSATDRGQGYGFLMGTRTSGSVDYCGGEGNVLRDCDSAGVYKNFVTDDATITPLSAAHATILENPNAAHGHELITQELQNGAGYQVNNAQIQSCDRQSGNANPTIGLSVGGYNSRVHVKYAELGTACDKVFAFTSASRNCEATLSFYSSLGPSTGTITDVGTKNAIRYPGPAPVTFTAAPVISAVSGTLAANWTAPTTAYTVVFSNGDTRQVTLTNGAATATWSGGLSSAATQFATASGLSTGSTVEIYNRTFMEAYYKGSWAGTTETIDTAMNMTLTRTGTGDYTIHWNAAQPNANWTANVLIDANVSNNGGMVAFSFGTQSTTDLRFFTFSQAAGVTTQVDPRKMLIRCRQAI